MLIQVLAEAQKLAFNSIPREVAEVIAREMDIPLSKIYEVVSFYAEFSAQPRGQYVIRLCKSAPCHVNGAQTVLEAFEAELGIVSGETTPDGKFTLESWECLGLCDGSPSAAIGDQIFDNLTPDKIKAIIAQY